MADWRQIQARIRKAKASTDAPAQLAQLYEKTRDAMVAFELARLHEKSGQNGEAIRWYTVAAERFRRAQWRTKAEEALARLGAPLPVTPAEVLPSSAELAPTATEGSKQGALGESRPPELDTLGEQTTKQAVAEEDASRPAPARGRRRRRGKRGGRRRRGKKAQTAPAPEARAALPTVAQPVAEHPTQAHRAEAGRSKELRPEASADIRRVSERPSRHLHAAETEGAPAAWQVRGRAGEPALASRLAQLESQLRRLLASPPCRLKDADQAPAGPGVFILSDSDQTTYYDIEACQTLRVGIGNLLRAERGARKGESVRARLAKHLGITESRVSKYLNDHCAVRWLQLDEGAAPLTHFAIAVLRPALND